ncbi:MAG: trypsin-like peptidase domain-containing protein [Dehalococcoidia bacterium]|nr:trypsin-like peptidase domain-containing protein [Dehalococcoidia bacterium]
MENAKSGSRLQSRLVSLILLMMLVGISGTAGAVISGVFFNTASAAPVLYNEEAVSALYEKVSPSVVEITVVQAATSRFGSGPVVRGQGSGFLVDAEGRILTNYHVVQGATQIRVILSDGRTLDAQIAGTSPADDIALLKVDPQAMKGIAPLPLGDSSAAKPGQMAIALGSPFGLENSITVGVVSGVNRSRAGITGRTITGMVQTDASINPGNSGGPLLNSRGEVIGINTAIETSASGATGVGFAIPVNTAKNILAQLLNNTTVKRPWLGISGVAISPDLSDQLGITTPRGIYIVAVAAGSPAEQAGLRGGGSGADGGPGTGGDIITAADGRLLRAVEDLVAYFNSLRPGDTVSLTLIRNGQTLQVRVVLAEWPDTLGG